MNQRVKKFRQLLFLKDTILLALTAFGGPQAHISHMFSLLVDKRRYLSEDELIELNALCQILPGPTSTQTITAIAYRKGGPQLALLTLLVWVLPAGIAMISLSIFFNQVEKNNALDLEFTKYIQPMAISFIFYSGFRLTQKVIKTKTGFGLFAFSIITSVTITYWLGTNQIAAILFPVLLVIGGLTTALSKRFHQKKEWRKRRITIEWKYFIWFISIFALAALLGNIFSNKFVLLFENFYRNGSLIFGGGQVLIPLIKTEFVELKTFLTNEEFLSGFGFVQGMPGPVFSICGYIGGMSYRESLFNQILAGSVSLAGIFLPGTLLIFFVIKFWDELKKYRVVKASIEGISAVASGMVLAAVITLLFMYNPYTNEISTSININMFDKNGFVNVAVMLSTLLLLGWNKIPPPFLIVIGILCGFFF